MAGRAVGKHTHGFYHVHAVHVRQIVGAVEIVIKWSRVKTQNGRDTPNRLWYHVLKFIVKLP